MPKKAVYLRSNDFTAQKLCKITTFILPTQIYFENSFFMAMRF